MTAMIYIIKFDGNITRFNLELDFGSGLLNISIILSFFSKQLEIIF